MSMFVYLDVETSPPDRDAALIQDKFAGCIEEEFRKLALNGEYGRLLCIGLIVEQDSELLHRGVLGRDRSTNQFHLDEARTLRAFWKLLSGFDDRRDLIIGFNILDFGLHFICLRSSINRVKPSFNVCFARFRERPIYDCMWEFSHWHYRIKLDDVAKVLGLSSSKQNGIDGSKVYDFFLDGRHQEICEYAMQDCECARKIYRRMKFLEETQ